MAKQVFTLVTRIREMATQQGGYASAPEVVSKLAIASQQAFNALIPAKAPRPLGPGLNRELDTRLAPFLRRESFPTSGGLFTPPATCAYVDFYEIAGAKEITEVSGAAWNSRVNDPNCGPTAEYPIIGEVTAGAKRVAPASIASVLAQFYDRPTQPVYAETYEDDVPVYNDANSVDTGWREDMQPELIVRTLRLLGLEIRDPQLQAVATQLTAEAL